MSKGNLNKNLEIFYKQIDERLKDLSSEEKQQYLEGLVHAFDAVSRYANLGLLTPIEREEFISPSKTQAYSKAYHLGLDPEKRMRDLIETESGVVAASYAHALEIQEAMGIPLDHQDQMSLDNQISRFNLKKLKDLEF